MSSGLPKSGERPFSFLTHTGVISTKKKIIALGIVNLVMLPLTITVACDPDTPESAFTPEEPVPEDPALYAPDSWPLEVGDTVMSEDWGDLVDQFVTVLQHGRAIRVVDGVAYKADFRTVDVVAPGADPLTAVVGYVYHGHVPIKHFWVHDDQVLPPELDGISEAYTSEDAIRMGLRPKPRYLPDGRVMRHGSRPDTVPVGRVAR